MLHTCTFYLFFIIKTSLQYPCAGITVFIDIVYKYDLCATIQFDIDGHDRINQEVSNSKDFENASTKRFAFY